MEHKPKLLNTHHYKNIENLPDNSVYIGRPSLYENSYSSQTGVYTREECVARHRLDLYKDLIENKDLLSQIKQDLLGKDLACWCVTPGRVVCCHGMTYLHILSEDCIDRQYDKSVLFYLMDDLRQCISKLSDKISKETETIPNEFWMYTYFAFEDMRLDISEALSRCKAIEVDVYSICKLVAFIVIDLEAAIAETDRLMVNYRILHVEWLTQYFFSSRTDRYGEPVSPKTVIKKPKKKE